VKYRPSGKPRHTGHTYSLKLTMDFSNLWKHWSIATASLMLLFTKYKTTWVTSISSHCLAALPAKMSAFNSPMPQNAYCRNFEVNLWRFVATLLLRNTEQQQNIPLASFATYFSRQMNGHEWTAGSSLQGTRTVNELDSCAVRVNGK